jgi:hypothetical protein
MPKLKEIDVSYDQIVELVHQLEFEKRMALIHTVMHERDYRKNFYRYTERLRKKYSIPIMSEEELDTFLSIFCQIEYAGRPRRTPDQSGDSQTHN